MIQRFGSRIKKGTINYLDNRDHVGGSGLKFRKINIEMIELVILCFVQDETSTIPYSVNAAYIGGGVQGWVRGSSDGHFRDGGW